MTNFKNLYFGLFNALSDILQEIEEENYETAKQIIIVAQQKAEEQYISDGEEAS